MTPLDVIRPQWSAPEWVHALVTTRTGGSSQGVYQSLNLGDHVDDDPQAVQYNRNALQKQLALPTKPIWLDQVHGTQVLRLPKMATDSVTADAAITAQAGVVCSVMTADCLPLLLTNQAGDEVAAVHAGWRGMAAGVIEQCVASFTSPAHELLAWAGPTISQAHFEVGEEVRAALGGSDACWRSGERAGKLYANLYQLAGERLAEVGVVDYHHSSACTFADPDRFYSHRRDGQTGRFASLIYFEKPA